jgi:hypothetical protein
LRNQQLVVENDERSRETLNDVTGVRGPSRPSRVAGRLYAAA